MWQPGFAVCVSLGVTQNSAPIGSSMKNLVNKDLDTEDFALLGSIAALLLASIADAAADSSLYKGAKIIALVVSLYLAWDRIRTARPFWKDVLDSEWLEDSSGYYEIRLSRKQHGRGKTPYTRAMQLGADGYARVSLIELVLADGTVVFRTNCRASLRLEVRK
jgi:hypothetical protein